MGVEPILITSESGNPNSGLSGDRTSPCAGPLPENRPGCWPDSNCEIKSGGEAFLRPLVYLLLWAVEPVLTAVGQDLVVQKFRHDCRSSRVETDYVQHPAVVRICDHEAAFADN